MVECCFKILEGFCLGSLGLKLVLYGDLEVFFDCDVEFDFRLELLMFFGVDYMFYILFVRFFVEIFFGLWGFFEEVIFIYVIIE